eukprot:SAG22_NODE_215_length_14950_cov_4.960676_2_plen_518_part_00
MPQNLYSSLVPTDGVLCGADSCVATLDDQPERTYVTVSDSDRHRTLEEARTFCRDAGYTKLASIRSEQELAVANELCRHATNGSQACFVGLHTAEIGQHAWTDSDGSVVDRWLLQALLQYGGQPDATWAAVDPRSPSGWRFQQTSETAQTFICEDEQRRDALLLSGATAIDLGPMTLGGSLSLSAWIHQRQTGWTAFFQSFQDSICETDSTEAATSLACRNSVDGTLDKGGWLAIGQRNSDALFIPGVQFDDVSTVSNFWTATAESWALVTVTIDQLAVRAFTDGSVKGTGMFGQPVPMMLRRENSIGSSLEVGKKEYAGFRLGIADFMLFGRGLSVFEATALWAEPFGDCCVNAGLHSGFGVGDIDLTREVMAAPSTVTVRPNVADDNATVGDPSVLGPCTSSAAAPDILREVDICRELSAVSECDVVVSDGRGPYPRSSECSLHLHLEGYDGTYRLQFTEFGTELNVDFVSVFDGGSEESNLLGRWSGPHIPGSISSTGPELLITFSSENHHDTH